VVHLDLDGHQLLETVGSWRSTPDPEAAA